MNTSAEVVNQLEAALVNARKSVNTINDLVAAHDYQDVAALVAQAAVALLESARQLMKMNDEGALDELARADDFLDTVWGIIDSEVSEEDEE